MIAFVSDVEGHYTETNSHAVAGHYDFPKEFVRVIIKMLLTFVSHVSTISLNVSWQSV
jgi:hypothetical protein